MSIWKKFEVMYEMCIRFANPHANVKKCVQREEKSITFFIIKYDDDDMMPFWNVRSRKRHDIH